MKEEGYTAFARLCETLKRLRNLIFVVAILYAGTIVAGVITWHCYDRDRLSFVTERDEASVQQIERIFGRFRQPIRQGDMGAIALSSLIVFTINMLGDFINFTLPGVLLVPLAPILLVTGWMQGLSLAQLQASSLLSLVCFLGVVFLESLTYLIASVAGFGAGLSFWWPARQGTTSRWGAFKGGWRDAGRLYVLVAILLAVQALCEILYVRKILLAGGTGIPLAPY